MANFSIQRKIVLGREIEICVSVTQDVSRAPSSNMICDVLGFKTKTYTIPKKDSFWSGLFNVSEQAITLCTFMGYQLSSIELVHQAVNDRSKIIAKWNEMHAAYNGNWDAMLRLMNENVDAPEESQLLPTPSDEFEFFTSIQNGDVLFRGTDRVIKYFEDKICLEAIRNESGMMGFINESTRIQDETIYYEDIRGITLYEGKSTTNVVLTNMLGGGDHTHDVIPYLRFELRGVNDIRTRSPYAHPYTVVIKSDQFSSAKKIKEFIEEKLRDHKKQSQQGGAALAQVSAADELLKYSSLLDKGLITEDEFREMKKKLLGL